MHAFHFLCGGCNKIHQRLKYILGTLVCMERLCQMALGGSLWSLKHINKKIIRKNLPCIYKISVALKSVTCVVSYREVGKQDFFYPSSLQHSSAISEINEYKLVPIFFLIS